MFALFYHFNSAALKGLVIELLFLGIFLRAYGGAFFQFDEQESPSPVIENEESSRGKRHFWVKGGQRPFNFNA